MNRYTQEYETIEMDDMPNEAHAEGRREVLRDAARALREILEG